MTAAAAEKRFQELQQKAQVASQTRQDYAIALRVKYGDAYYRGWLGKAQTRQLETLQRAETRAADRFFAFLRTIAGRQFARGFPFAWLVEALTYADAVTHDAMSVQAPPAYGLTPADMTRYCGPVHVAGE